MRKMACNLGNEAKRMQHVTNCTQNKPRCHQRGASRRSQKPDGHKARRGACLEQRSQTIALRQIGTDEAALQHATNGSQTSKYVPARLNHSSSEPFERICPRGCIAQGSYSSAYETTTCEVSPFKENGHATLCEWHALLCELHVACSFSVPAHSPRECQGMRWNQTPAVRQAHCEGNASQKEPPAVGSSQERDHSRWPTTAHNRFHEPVHPELAGPQPTRF